MYSAKRTGQTPRKRLTPRRRGWYAPAVFRYVLLSLLADGQPAHGYALMKVYTERSGVRISIGNVYRELQRLIADGLITTAPRPAGTDARRAPYTITEAGRAALSAWLRTRAQAGARNSLDEFSARLAALGDMEPGEAATLVKDLHAELWAEAKAVESHRASLAHEEGTAGRLFPIREILLTRRAMQLAADIDLLDQVSACLAERPTRPATAPARTAPTFLRSPTLGPHRRPAGEGSGEA